MTTKQTHGMGLNIMSAECDRGDLNYLDTVDFVSRAIYREEGNKGLIANGEVKLRLKMGPQKNKIGRSLNDGLDGSKCQDYGQIAIGREAGDKTNCPVSGIYNQGSVVMSALYVVIRVTV